MTVSRSEIIRGLSRPLEPATTGVAPRLRRLPDVRCVLFDVYGTLLISGSGEIGIAAAAGREEAFAEAVRAAGITHPVDAAVGVAAFYAAIERRHEAGRAVGAAYPEIDLVDVWREVLAFLPAGPSRGGGANAADAQRAALEFELRVNPVWPMPGVEVAIEGLRELGITLGVLSNAQALTRELFPALLERSLEELGFDRALQFYSYQHGQAKPGPCLYDLARRAITRRGWQPRQILMVGNDMLNDILPAAAVGFRTALFAGDARSYRPRENDPRVTAARPDLVLTQLDQLPECLATELGELTGDKR